MTSLDSNVIKKFCELCDWTYQSWVTHKRIFEDNPDKTMLEVGHCCSPFLSRLSLITSEYTMHQIAKLHDPAIYKKDINLTFDYVINHGGWDSQTLKTLNELYCQLEELNKSVRKARNKIFSHNRATKLQCLKSGKAKRDDAVFISSSNFYIAVTYQDD